MKKGITIGMDLGDKKHQVCILDKTGKIIAEEAVTGTRAAMTVFFKQYRGAVVAMETGTHSRWVSQIAEAEGLQVLVGNAPEWSTVGPYLGLVPRLDPFPIQVCHPACPP